ncbi:MAG: 2-C-methyl-D-erythritol 2,4-cyclodiphosphate synthase [Actinomycetota bacterium]
MRVGLGVDVHAFDPPRPLVLGGVTIDEAPGLAGWSDADVACHAVADALLGAAGLGDLGAHFPEERMPEGSSSLELLAETLRKVAEAGFRPVNVDVTVIAQAVRLARYREAMAARMASVLDLEAGAVNVKATTTDRLGFLGREEGMAAMAVVLIEPVTA